MEIVGNHAYVVSAGSLEIIDVSDPTRPVTVVLDQSAGYYGIDVAGPYIYFADGGFVKIFARQPPVQLKIISANTGVVSMRVSGPFGLSAQIQSSEDLNNWMDVTDPVTLDNAPVSASDPEGSRAARRFYRAVVR